jgi:hypothetical protein
MAGIVNVQVDGLSALQGVLNQFGQNASQALGAALYQEAELVMTDSKANYVPVDTGMLRSTGHVDPPQMSGNQVSVTLGYGGPSAPYALRQHEDLSYRHTVGQAKYLEEPLLKAANGMAGRIGDKLRSEL